MKRSGFAVMARLAGLVRPLAGYMALAVTMGLTGHLCATFLTVLGGYGILGVLGAGSALPLAGLAVAATVLAVLRAALRYGEQACNHFIAFKLLALLRDKVFRALRRLAPAKLEGREKGDLIAVITSDIELLEVFYAHTISPVLIAVLFSAILTAFIGSFHPLLGTLALTAYAVVGIGVPLAVSRASGPDGLRLRNEAGALAGFVLDSLGATLQNTFAAGNRVLDLLEEEPLTRDIHGQPDVTFAGAGAEKVTFGYGEDTILRDVTVPVPAGQTIGIVGKSGSGKSTLLKLFLRFWQVGKGRVQLSGRSVEAINTKNLRRMQALVTQDSEIARSGIPSATTCSSPGRTPPTMSWWLPAKRRRSTTSSRRCPGAMTPRWGELGDTLSGGERQRLGLARAFLHDAPFLLLDEPTSNLDSLNEAVILRALEKEHGNRTVVLVSHRRPPWQSPTPSTRWKTAG